MYADGQSYVNEPLWERRKKLYEYFSETGNFSFVSFQELPSYDEDKIKAFLASSVEKGAEGLMVKMLGYASSKENALAKAADDVQATSSCCYEAGTRSNNWLKVKRDYVAGFADTIDVVPIGAWYGNGRKAQKSFLSPVLLAVYDDEEDVYRSICRCMSFTDQMYESMREFYFRGTPYPETLSALKSVGEVDDCNERSDDEKSSGGSEGEVLDDPAGEPSDDNEVDDAGSDRVNCFPNRPSTATVITNESPSIWFRALEVFEVSFADLTLSTKHTAAAGMVDEAGRGVALRFPRFKRRRPDKTPEQATTSVEIAQLYAKQSKIKRGG